MAAGRKGRWIAIGGATAAVAIGVCGAVAIGAPSGLVVSQPVTNATPHLTWGDDNDAGSTGYSVQRHKGDCSNLAEIATPTVKSFDDTGLQPGGADDGSYCYQVVGHYTADPDATTNTASVLYDTTAPTQPTIALSPVPSGSAVSGSLTVTATSTDGGSGVLTTVIALDGNPAVNGATNAVFPWNTAGVQDGLHTLTATATDAAGNPSAIRTVQVTVKNSLPGAPVVTAQSPVAGSPTLVWAPKPGETYTITRDGVVKATNQTSGQWTDGPETATPGTYTYVVTAIDAANHATASAPLPVTVIPPSVTAPRSVAASSPTNTVPHLTWQPPVTFAVLNWRIYRDGAALPALLPAAAGSFDDSSLTTQGPHLYAVQAVNGASSGDKSSPVSVTYDSMAPALDSATAIPAPDGSIAVDWPAAVDPLPGSGLASYIVRRGATPPTDPSSGTAICTLQAPNTGCVDTSTKTGTVYGYSVFAFDGAGNFVRRDASAKASDTLPPDAVTGIRALASSPTAVRLTWDVPPLKGNNADLAGYRVLQLRPGAKAPLGPQDGAILCKNVAPDLATCDALKLTKGKKVSFAVYAFDGVPNYSSPTTFSFIPRKTDNKPPHKPTKVKLRHNGLRYLLTWVSPRDADLSKFRVTLYKKPPTRPSLGKAVVNGRVLGTTFLLKAGQRVYVTLYALDVSGNYSKVTKYVVAPGGIAAKSNHKVVKKKAGTKKPALVTTKPPRKKKVVKDKPIPVAITSPALRGRRSR